MEQDLFIDYEKEQGKIGLLGVYIKRNEKLVFLSILELSILADNKLSDLEHKVENKKQKFFLDLGL